MKATEKEQKSGIKAFYLYVILPMVIGLAIISNKPEPFNYKNTLLKDFEVSGNLLHFNVPSLGRMKYIVHVPDSVNNDSKISLSYTVENNRITGLQNIMVDNKIIW